MGLDNGITEQMGTKLSIIGGKFTIRATEGTHGAEPRKLTKGKNKGKVVWEVKHQRLSNVYLIAGKQIDGDYPGADIILRDANTGDDYTINFPLDSGYLYELIRFIPNLDISKPCNIEMHERNKGGKIRHHLRIAQNGKLLPDYYTEWSKDNKGNNVATPLHGIPQPTKDHKGWNFRNIENYLLEKFQDFFNDFTPSVPHHIATGSDLDSSDGGYDRRSSEHDDDRPPLSDADVPADLDEEDDIPF